MIPRAIIEGEDYDLSLSQYKEDVFEEVKYESPKKILENLIKEEIGDTETKGLSKIKSGIIRELLELREMFH